MAIKEVNKNLRADRNGSILKALKLSKVFMLAKFIF